MRPEPQTFTEEMLERIALALETMAPDLARIADTLVEQAEDKIVIDESVEWHQ